MSNSFPFNCHFTAPIHFFSHLSHLVQITSSMSLSGFLIFCGLIFLTLTPTLLWWRRWCWSMRWRSGPEIPPFAHLLLLPNQRFGTFLNLEEGASFCHLSFGGEYIFLKISIKIPYMPAAALIKWQCYDLTAALPNYKRWWLCHNLLLQQLPLLLLQLLGEGGNIASDSPWVLAVCQTQHSVMYTYYFIWSSQYPCEVSPDTSYLIGRMGTEANPSHSKSEGSPSVVVAPLNTQGWSISENKIAALLEIKQQPIFQSDKLDWG